MNRTRLPILVALLSVAASGAHAQGFFERLFGLAPSRPEPPPVVRQAPPPEGPTPDVAPRIPVAPVQAKPVAVRAPSEESVIGRDLKHNGATGSMRIERTGGDYRVRLTMLGRKSAESPETCSIQLGGGQPVTLVSQGRPEGAQRFQIQDPACAMQLDLLEESVLVKGPENGVCVFEKLGCQVDPSGLWGPEPGALIPRAKDFEQIRGTADKAARDNYKVLSQRAKPENVRPIVAEQAAFSADREQVCRSYAREGAHGFCNARYSEARALSLATRLGITGPVASQSAQSDEPPRQPRQRRSRVLDSDDAYGLPPTDDIMPVR